MVRIICICTECVETITDPVCASCFEREFFSWFNEQNLPKVRKSELRVEALNLMSAAKHLSFSNISCILCGNKMQNICNYCLMRNLFGIVKYDVSNEEARLVLNYASHDFGIKRGGLV